MWVRQDNDSKKIFSQNVCKNRLLTDTILENNKYFDILFIQELCYDWYLIDATWTRVKGNNDMIGCTTTVSVSVSCSRCYILALSSCYMTCLPHVLWTLSLWLYHIYSVDTILYPYAFPLIHSPSLFSSLCLSATWALS